MPPGVQVSLLVGGVHLSPGLQQRVGPGQPPVDGRHVERSAAVGGPEVGGGALSQQQLQAVLAVGRGRRDMQRTLALKQDICR